MYNPGVLALWGRNKITSKIECLTVGQSINLYNEWITFKRRASRTYNKPFTNKDKSGRWCFISDEYDNFEFIVVNSGMKSFKSRELLEMHYAILKESRYWKPSVTQAGRCEKIKLQYNVNN